MNQTIKSSPLSWLSSNFFFSSNFCKSGLSKIWNQKSVRDIFSEMASIGQCRFLWVRDKRYSPYFWQQFFPSHIWWFLLPMIVARHMRKHWLWVSHRIGGKCTWLLTTFMRGQPPSIVFSFLWSRNCFHAVLLKHTASPSPGAPCLGRQITIAAFSTGFFTSSSSSSSSASWASSARYWGGQSTAYTSQ